MVARQPHKLEVAGSNPARATGQELQSLSDKSPIHFLKHSVEIRGVFRSTHIDKLWKYQEICCIMKENVLEDI